MEGGGVSHRPCMPQSLEHGPTVAASRRAEHAQTMFNRAILKACMDAVVSELPHGRGEFCRERGRESFCQSSPSLLRRLGENKNSLSSPLPPPSFSSIFCTTLFFTTLVLKHLLVKNIRRILTPRPPPRQTCCDLNPSVRTPRCESTRNPATSLSDSSGHMFGSGRGRPSQRGVGVAAVSVSRAPIDPVGGVF